MFKFTVATFQEICKSNHYAVHLQCCMSICILIKLGKKQSGEAMEKMEPQGTNGRNVNWCSHYGNSMVVPQKLKIGLPYNPAIPFLGIYPRNKKQGVKDIYVLPLSMQQVLFTTAKIWKQLKYPSTDKLIKMWYPLEEKMATHSSILIWKIPWTEEPGRLQSMGSQSQMRLSTHTFTMEYYSAPRKKKILSFSATWIKLEGAILQVINQKGKEKFWCHWHVKSFKGNKKRSHS